MSYRKGLCQGHGWTPEGVRLPLSILGEKGNFPMGAGCRERKDGVRSWNKTSGWGSSKFEARGE